MTWTKENQRDYMREYKEQMPREQRERYRAQSMKYTKTPEFREAHRESHRLNSIQQRQKYPERWAARDALRRAVRSGKLQRPDKCQSCGITPPREHNGRTAIHGHHHKGYEFPFDVLWLCRTCHIKVHRTLAATRKEQPNAAS